LLAIGLVDGTTTVIDAEFGGWEQGSSALHLAADGTVVGETFSGPVSTVAVYSSSGLDAAALGLEPEYVDCAGCPSRFSISPSGRTVAWIEGTELVIVDRSTGNEATRLAIGDALLTASDLYVDDRVALVVRNYSIDVRQGPLVVQFDADPVETVELAGLGDASLSSLVRRCQLASYSVQSGDTLASVAMAYGVSLDAVMSANVATPDFDAFGIGLEIVIPQVNCN
jgi:hypothetical protein